MAKAWIRVLEVRLTSSLLKRQLVFGSGESELNIEVQGTKYMSTLKDTCVVRISNLTYKEIVQIIQGKFYDVEVKAGYRNSNIQTVFKGGVLYVSNAINDTKTNTIILVCTSQMIAKYGQSRLNLSLNSGINLYSAIKFIARRAGIPNSNVSTQFKKQFLQDVVNVNENAASWIDNLCSDNSSFIVNSDSIVDSVFSVYDSNKSNARVIKLNNDNINLIGGYPRLTSNGLSLSIMPTFSFMCGDVIQIDNSIIQIPVASKEEVQKNYGYYLDKDGMYMIFEIEYSLQNRGPDFSFNLNCKTRSLISNFIGGTS